MSEIIEIAIVDDHPFFRDGVERALRRAKDVKFVAQASCAADARRIAKEQRPNIMLLDIDLPGGGIEAVRAIVADGADVKVIMLTVSDDDEHVTNALAAGASGYLLKGADTAELLEAVRTVHLGQPYITPALSSRLLMRQLRSRSQPAAPKASRSELNFREQQILGHAARGLTNHDIAATLDIALPTVKNYMSRIFQKMQVRNRAEAIAVHLSDGAGRTRLGP
jgi:two-component system, NarL family, nitrate/nitrite response regulator NarL